jgi:hypothetical protein
MGLMQKLRVILFGRRRRALERNELRKFIQIKVIIDGLKYTIGDFSTGGISLNNEAKTNFEVGKTYSCIITLRGDPRLNLKLRVSRVEGKLVGCEVLDKDMFERFVNSNLKVT